MTTHSVDDLLVKDMQNQQAPVQAIPNTQPDPASDAPTPPTEPQVQGDQAQDKSDVPSLSQQDAVPNLAQDQPKTDETKPTEAKAANIDEYGNPIEKPRTYTEDEVQHIINDRMAKSRIALKQQEMQQQTQKISEDFKADPNSEESWETQLNTFIDKRLETRQAQLSQQQWQQQEAQRQAEFEAKFSNGMTKYQDFEQVVSKAAPSITPSMMLATRSLENPAAFVYAAAKLHPAELDRIARIGDPYVQAAEVGRLHERMVKVKGTVSAAPKPIEVVKGDVPNKPLSNDRSLDQRIFDYAKQKRR
jgi:hypothetical protein